MKAYHQLVPVILKTSYFELPIFEFFVQKSSIKDNTNCTSFDKLKQWIFKPFYIYIIQVINAYKNEDALNKSISASLNKIK